MDQQRFNKKLSNIIAQFEKPTIEFSRVQEGILKTLLSVESQANSFGAHSPELGKVNYYAGILEAYNGNPESSTSRLKSALAANARSRFLDHQHVWTAQVEIARNYLRMNQTDHGLEAFAELEKALSVPEIDNEFRIRYLQHIGYLLHEYGLFREALALNKKTLEIAEVSTDCAPDCIINIRRNISENYYCLGQLDDARRIQEELYALAEREHNYDLWTQSCFKLAVLAHEAFDNARAEHLLQQSLKIAETSNDEALIEQAHDWLTELYRRIELQQQEG